MVKPKKRCCTSSRRALRLAGRVLCSSVCCINHTAGHLFVDTIFQLAGTPSMHCFAACNSQAFCRINAQCGRTCRWNEKSRALLMLLRAPSAPAEEQQPLVDDLTAALKLAEDAVQKYGGPHLFGKLSIADLTVAPFLPRLAHADLRAVQLSAWPGVAKAIDALCALPSYKETAVDWASWRALSKAYFGVAEETVRKPYLCWPFAACPASTQMTSHSKSALAYRAWDALC